MVISAVKKISRERRAGSVVVKRVDGRQFHEGGV